MGNDTRQAIIWATLKRQSIHPFDPVTLDKVASDVGISKTAIFHYFPNKDALLHDVDAYLRDEASQMRRRVLEEGSDPLAAFTSELIARKGSLYVYAHLLFGPDRPPLFHIGPVFGLEGKKDARSELAFRAGVFFPMAFHEVICNELPQEQIPAFVARVRRWYDHGLGLNVNVTPRKWSEMDVDPSQLASDRNLSALNRLFSTYGIQGVTMGRMAKETGLAQSSFYYQFANKEEMISKTGKDEVARFLKLLDGRLSVVKEIEDAVITIFGTTNAYYFARPWLSRVYAFVSAPALYLHPSVLEPYPHLRFWRNELSAIQPNAGELALFLPLIPPMHPTESGWGKDACDAHAISMLSRYSRGSDREVL